MGMYDNILTIYQKLSNDEELLRLLYYPPEDIVKGIKDPLDSSLPNILSLPVNKIYEIKNDRVKKTPKSDDLEDKQICRIYIYSGRRNPNNGNYLLADQKIIIDCLIHNSFQEGDLRLERVSDRINKLLVHGRIVGIGEMEYDDGDLISAPKEYIGFRHIYNILVNKK